MIPIIVISLCQSKDRRTKIEAHLNALDIPFAFFDGVDGNELPIEEVESAGLRPYPRRPFPLLRTELGCIASFREVCWSIGRGKDEFVCVLEDDVVLEGNVRHFLELCTLHCLPAFDILRIHATNSRHSMQLGTFEGLDLSAPYWPGWGMYAQIFSRTGASKIAQGFTNPSMPGDHIAFYDCMVPNLRILEVAPPLATHPAVSDDSSTIDPEGLRLLPWPRQSIYERWKLWVYNCRLQYRLIKNFVGQWGLRSLAHLILSSKSRSVDSGLATALSLRGPATSIDDEGHRGSIVQ